MKEKGGRSTIRNIGYSFRTVLSVDKKIPIIRTLLLLSALALSLYATYESKLFLDALSSGRELRTIILMIIGTVLLGLLISTLNMAVSHICGYLTNVKLSYNLYLKSYLPLFFADYDKMESPEYKNTYLQYRKYAVGAVLGEFGSAAGLAESALALAAFGTVISLLHPLIVIGLIIMSVLHFLAKKPLIRLQHKLNIFMIENDRKFSYATGVSTDFSNAKEVRLYNMSPWLRSITDECMARHRKLHGKLQWCTFGVGVCHQLLRLIRDGFAYIYLILLFSAETLTAGDFVLYFTAITGFSDTLNKFTEHFGEINKYSLQIDEIRKTEKIKSNRNRGAGLPIPCDGIAIEFCNVSFRYPNATDYTIKNLSLTIEPKEKVALVGVNGAGKTTLVKLLCGLYVPTEGVILMNGRPVNEYNINEYYSVFSAVFQDINVMPLTVAQNIACTVDDSKIDVERVWEAIRKAGLYEKIISLEKGINTYFDKEVNRAAVEFSGGEKQKLALARAIYMNRPFLVLDEPTSALDPIAEYRMYMRFNEITMDSSALFISHRLVSTRFCDRIILLENGEIIESGTHDELMRKNGKYAEMFRTQSKYYVEKVSDDNE